MSFRFKQFEIIDENTPMKVGVDGVIIGSHIIIQNPIQILDVGAGSGLISMMLAQRYSDAKITAIEINNSAFLDCENNFSNSNWSNRLKVINGDFLDFGFNKKFDAIVSNPPYFVSHHDNENEGRKMARKSEFLPLDSFFAKSAELLTMGGEIFIIFPFENRNEIIKTALLNGLFLKFELKIKDTQNVNFSRILLGFTNISRNLEISSRVLILKNTKGAYTDEFARITSEFYL